MELFSCLNEILEQVELAVASDENGRPSGLSGIGLRLLVVQARMKSLSGIIDAITECEELKGPSHETETLSCLVEMADRCTLDYEDPELSGFKPNAAIAPSEAALGELPDHLKRLFVAAGYLSAEIRSLESRLGKEATTGSKELKFFRCLESLMEQVLWHEIKDAFNLWGLKDKVVGVRLGWMVVVFEDRRKKKTDVPEEHRSDDDIWKELGIFPIKGFSFKK